VFGIPDDKFGEVPAAYIQLKPGATLTEADVVAQCEARLARLKRPRLVKFVDGFPKTPIGKIQKNVLKAPFWLGRGTQSMPPAPGLPGCSARRGSPPR